MDDLKEHIGLVLTVIGGLLTIVGILIAVIWNEARNEASKFSKWLAEMAEKGGVVSRNDHFDWCKQEMGKCPVSEMVEWKCDMFDKGGPLMKTEHSALCKEVTQQISQMFMGELKHNRELMVTELKLIQATLETKVVNEISALRSEMVRQAKLNGQK